MPTYRQLHAKKIGPHHPLRVIAHCDVDAAYAQFEQVRLKIPPDKPLAVQQWRGLIAVNYPARAFGITRHLPFDEARKMCPHLICVHVATYAQGDSETEAKYHENPKPETHKVSLDPYRRESVKILKIFSENCPTIEKASIDEAFLDFSIPVREILCSRYGLLTPEALQKRSSEISLDNPLPQPPRLDWDTLLEPSQTNIIPLDAESEQVDSWTDIALLIGAELMAQCRQKVFDQLGYTCSAGIATNKMLAKLCSAYKKPNAQTVLRPGAVRDFLRPFEVSKVRFLGGKLGQSVAELISSSIAEPDAKACVLSEVWKIPLGQLQASLGEETGMWVWETVRGVDRSEVETKTHVKSMMSSKNFRPSINTWNQGLHWLRILARDLFARLNEAREAAPGIWPKVIVMHKRDGAHNSFAKQIAFPFTAQLTDEYIFLLGQKLLQEFAVRRADQTFQLGTVTSLALAFQTLERIEPGQRGIQGFFAPQRNLSAHQPPELLTTVQASGQQPGPSHPGSRPSEDIPSPKPSTQTPRSPASKKRRAGAPSVGIAVRPSLLDSSKTQEDPPLSSDLSADRQLLTFVCPRCQEVIALDAGPYDDDAEKRTSFERLKNIHLDHHFALDLWDKDNQAHPGPSTSARHSSSSAHRSSTTQPVTKKPRAADTSSSSSLSAPRPAGAANNRGIKDFFKPVPAGTQRKPKPQKRKK